MHPLSGNGLSGSDSCAFGIENRMNKIYDK